MNNSQDNEGAMFTTVRGVCDATPDAWNGMPALVETYGRFGATVDQIDDIAKEQNLPTKGLTKAKHDARATMAEASLVIGGAVHAYASKNNNSDLAEKSDSNMTDFMQGNDRGAAIKARGLKTLATSNLAALADSGITTAKLTVFETKIKVYEDLLSKPREAKVGNKTATALLEKLFADANKILKEELDGLVLGLKETQPKFVSDYFNARNIIDNGGGHASPPPTPPTT